MDWVDRLAAELHLEALSAHENEHLLTASREVAHRVERKATPLATFLVGAAVQREIGHGRTHAEAFDQVMASLRTIL